nr:hypothetical protein OH837_48105 [Streptomyces canus]
MDADAFEVDRDGGQYVLDVGLLFAAVAALPHAVTVDELADRAIDGGPQRVTREPFPGLLLGPRLGLGVVLMAVVDADDHAAGGVGLADTSLASSFLPASASGERSFFPSGRRSRARGFQHAVQIVLGEVIGVLSQGGGEPCGQSHRYSSVFTACG